MNFVRQIIVASVVVLLAACSKSDNDDHEINNSDVTAPVIEIFTPTENQVFNNSSSINITGRITDNLGLYRGTIRITNDANAAVIKEQSYEIHGLLTYDFNLSHTVSVAAAADYTVTVRFEDHGLNVSTKSVRIKV